MKQNITYQTATKNDFAELIKIRIEYLKSDFENFSEVDEKNLREKLPQYFKNHLNRDFFAFVAKSEEKIVAAAFFVIIEKPANPNFPNGKIGDVLNVYTLPEFRRLGIATELMTMLLDFAKKSSLDFVELKATKFGFPIYKKLGFVETQSDYVEMKYNF